MSDNSLKIRCAYTHLVPINELTPNPDNPNKHPESQIKRLAEIIYYQGIRRPITVSNQTKLVNVGHGELEALKLLGVTEAPVDYQDFENFDQEYAHMVADNAIASWSEQMLSEINKVIPRLGPDIEFIKYLGLNKDFKLDTQTFDPGSLSGQGKLDTLSPVFCKCPKCGEEFNSRENLLK